MKSLAWLILYFLTAFLNGAAQTTIGIPEITGYNKQKYGAGMQNWDIRQDASGIMYFANNEGLLSFDGTYWKLFPLPNKTIVRSVEISKDNIIYVGGQDEIGYFTPGKNGELEYTSLKPLIPEANRSFTDVWDIYVWGTDVFFRTRESIFQLSGRNITVHSAPAEWLFLGKNNDKLIAQDARDGLMYFTNGGLLKMNIDIPEGMIATSVLSYHKDMSLLTSVRHGVWLMSNNSIRPFPLKNGNISKQDNISNITRINDRFFAISTTTSGCYIINEQGEVTQHFSKGTGLSNSSVISIFCDRNRNLWLGLDNGVDFIAFDNAVKHINPGELNNSAGYTSAVFDNKLYLATSNGVYKINIQPGGDLSSLKTGLTPVVNSQGQAWGLSTVNNHLLLGSHEGFYEIRDDVAEPVKKATGYWTFSNYYDEGNGETIVAGNYNGVTIYNYTGSTIAGQFNVPGYNESSRFLIVDKNNTIWTSHPYRGVYKIEKSGAGNFSVKLYTEKNGLPSYMSNHVYKAKNRVVIATEKGIYEYNRGRDQFEPSEYFQSIFKQTSIRYLREDKNGNIWFIHEKDLGVVDFSTLNPKIIYLPELKGKMVSGFEHINPIDDNNVLIGGQEGFYHINYEKYRKNDLPIFLDIRNVTALGKTDSILFGGYRYKGLRSPEISHERNSFHIEYSSPLFEQQTSIEYSYYLEGFDNMWSEWSKKTEKDYTNLPEGTYHFMVKARNNLGNESAPATYTFIVLPPWYRTTWAYAFYITIAVCFGWYLYKRSQKKFYKQRQEYLEKQKQLEYLHQLELEKSEKEIVKLKNEKLQAEIAHKNSELASTAMHLVQKGEILAKIKDELVKLNKQPGNKEVAGDIRKMVKVLKEDDKVNEDWEHFAGHFNNVHSDFLISLKEKYPNLNAHDLKFCAYLRMNLTSKEIAQLMNISIRGVEIGRYRLRKKLQIETKTNLFDFLLNLHPEGTLKT